MVDAADGKLNSPNLEDMFRMSSGVLFFFALVLDGFTLCHQAELKSLYNAFSSFYEDVTSESPHV